MLTEQLTRLGVDDPEGWAQSEIEEDIPQVAYARLQRSIQARLLNRSETMEVWLANLQRERERHLASRSAAVANILTKCLDAGVNLKELGQLVDDIAFDTASGFAYLLADAHDDLEQQDDLPMWVLCEVRSPNDGMQPTGRYLDGLHEGVLQED